MRQPLLITLQTEEQRKHLPCEADRQVLPDLLPAKPMYAPVPHLLPEDSQQATLVHAPVAEPQLPMTAIWIGKTVHLLLRLQQESLPDLKQGSLLHPTN